MTDERDERIEPPPNPEPPVAEQVENWGRPGDPEPDPGDDGEASER
jgi:hypothetical protein